jgi:hypothetical protein
LICPPEYPGVTDFTPLSSLKIASVHQKQPVPKVAVSKPDCTSIYSGVLFSGLEHAPERDIPANRAVRKTSRILYFSNKQAARNIV